MAGYPPPYSPYGPGPGWKYERRMRREQARAQRDIFRAQRDMYRAQYKGLRRGSIVGPILIIVIGVLFLLVQTGRLAGARVWLWYGRWWPLLLIAAGVLVLFEWSFDRFVQRDPGKVYARRSLGGAVVTLLVLLAVAGVASQGIHYGGTPFNQSFSFNQEDVDQFLGEKHESDQTQAQEFPTHGTLEVDNPRGDVTVSGTSDDSLIHIITHREVYSQSDSEAAAKAQRLNPALNTTGTNVQLRVPAVDGARVDLIVTLPAASGCTVMANHGDIHMSSIKGPVTMTANHGDMEVSAITGPVTAHIQNSKSGFSAHSITGPVELEGRGDDVTIADIDGPVSMQGDFFGDTHLEHIRGGFKFHSTRTDFQLARLDGEASFSDDDLSADQAAGPILLSTRNRNITLDRIAGDVTVTNRNGKIDLTSAPPLGNITVENRNGEVSVTLPDEAPFNVHAETSDGNIQNDFAFPVTESDNHRTVTGTIGKGTATVKITTTQEDVSLKRARVAPLPPLPPLPPNLTAMPSDARSAIEDARRSAKEAQQDARQTAEEAKREAKQTANEAKRTADEARREAKQTAEEARREARLAADEARREAKQAAQNGSQDASHP